MRFIDRLRAAIARGSSVDHPVGDGPGRSALRNALTGVALFAGCSTPLSPDRAPGRSADDAVPPPAGAPPAARAPTAAPLAISPATPPIGDDRPQRPEVPGTRPGRGKPSPVPVVLAPPVTQRDWQAVRLQAARRLVAANPDGSYTGKPPDVLLAIPVLQIELHDDGRIRRIDVLRAPKQATDTTQLAIAALHRAAPFGDVSRLPKPWRFTETFLFDNERRFKPRTLD